MGLELGELDAQLNVSLMTAGEYSELRNSVQADTKLCQAIDSKWIQIDSIYLNGLSPFVEVV